MTREIAEDDEEKEYKGGGWQINEKEWDGNRFQKEEGAGGRKEGQNKNGILSTAVTYAYRCYQFSHHQFAVIFAPSLLFRTTLIHLAQAWTDVDILR